jgi:hypothetical protein
VPFVLPKRDCGKRAVEVTTVVPDRGMTDCAAGEAFDLPARSVNLLL